MHSIPVLVKSCLIILISFWLFACQQEPESRIYQQISHYSFDDTLLNLDIAISEFNYRIIHRNNIGQAIRDRGDATFPLSTITSFCNISYAKEMLLINSDLINDMPCNIAVLETASGEIVVSTTLMDEQTGSTVQRLFAKRINTNLKDIIGATVE